MAAELLELVQVPGIGAYTARQLYRKGMTSPEVIALVVDEEGVEGIIDALKSQPLGGGGGDQRIVIRAARIARAVKEYMRK